MGLDFDVLEFCKKLRQDRPPPYQCPLEKCDRVYKSLCGLQYHLVNYDHDNPTPITPAIAPNRKKGRARAPVPTGDIALQSPPKEALTFAEAQKVVQFEIDGKISRINIDQVLPVISLDEWNKKNSELEKPIPFTDPTPEPHVKLPEASFHEIEDYNIADAPPRPNAYIRFIEKSAEELDGEVEYDVDEEDTAWLSILNEKRQKQNLAAVSVDTLELLMDRLEKESFFQAAQSGQSSGTVVDEDAVCCICMDGECQNTNVILFCDMCNLAVHQDCYGVPYIPEGQWLCRRCLQSPSRLVDCDLCPNTGGALKQTDRGTWAHVVCALWIPEVRFANTVFLEPIDSIETIPPARWKLTCYVCKQKGVGACIQCHKTNCYAAFHVTCAQHAGLYMKMDAVNGPGRGGALDPAQAVQVAKMAYCDAHTPPGVLRERQANNNNNNNNNNENDNGVSGSSAGGASGTPNKKQAIKAPPTLQRREKMKEARRMLAKKRSSVPVVLIPTIPPDRVQEIASLVNMAGRAPFVQRLIAYWTLKRQYRNGVPLLRRLQSLNHHSSGGGRSGLQDGSVDSWELYSQLKYWQRIRQDLERARLLCELVRKRERMKAEHTRVSERALMHQLKPVQASLRKLLNMIMAKDTSDIFSEPVDPTEVPDYSSVVTHPMDLSTMSQNLDKGLYPDLETLEKDFKLMINNCLAYNSKDTVFYKAGIKMMDQCSVIIKQARKDMLEAGLIHEKQPVKEPSSTPTKNSSENASVKTPTKKLRDRKASTNAVTTPVKEEDLNDKMEEEISLLMANKHPTEEEIQKIHSLAVKWNKSSQFQASPRLAKKLKSALQLARKRMASGGRKRKRTRGHSDESHESEHEEAEQATPATPSGARSATGVTNAASTSTSKKIGSSPPGTPHTPIPSERTPTKRSPMSGASTPGDPSPTGVNRRTAVLFTRKAQSAAAFGSTATSSVGTTTPKIPRRSELAALTASGSSPNVISGSSTRRPSATPTGNSADSTLDSSALSPSKNPSTNETPSKKKGRGRPRKHNKNSDRNKSGQDKASSASRQASVGSQTVVPLSFLEYRGPRDEVGSGVDSDSAHSTASFSSSCSSCTPLSDDDASSCDEACSSSSSGSDNFSYVKNRTKSSNQFLSDTENSVTRMSGKIGNDLKGSSARQWSTEEGSDGESSQATSTKERKRGRTPSKKSAKGTDVEKMNADNLEPLQLVWAKCRGYPWYPALIIDPKIPKGFIHNGVPLPVPPQDVLALKKNHSHEPILYLVLFFDAKRTWQWLPPNKLEPLGIKKSMDQAKLIESRKPADRKAVKKAYQDAMQYRRQVDGEQFTSK